MTSVALRSTPDAPVPARPSATGPRRRRPLPAHWPLTVLIGGYPLWWVLGLDSFLPLLLAVPMAAQLLRRRTLVLPPGFGWWVLFLTWTVLGVALLWSDAPGAVPGGDSSRLLVFAFRLAWYAACTVVLLWVANTPQAQLPTRLVHGLGAWLFVLCTAGGVLGVLAPEWEIRSLVETLLPGGLAQNPFVASLVHPQAADVQMVLGRPEPRPKAPFPFTNTWGSCLSLCLVFLLALDRSRSVLLRVLVPLVVAVALWPVAYSLNRGLWASLALGLLIVLLLRLVRGDRVALVVLVLGTVAGLAALLASPLGDLYGERLEHQHSNGRRTQLLEATTGSVTDGSPVLGFGSTRDVQGSFASITGAATPECPACGVPPLGTQGQLWLVLFSQGWPGLAFFLLFVALALARSIRCRTKSETVATVVVAFFVLQLPIYDTLGLPLYLVMVAVGLATRERPPPAAHLARWLRRRGGLRGAALLVAATSAAGSVLGASVAVAAHEPSSRTRVLVLVTPSPVYLATGPTREAVSTGDESPPREITVDTEAALVLSQRALGAASAATGLPVPVLRDAVKVTAAPSSQVLELAVRLPSATDTRAGGTALAEAYLTERERFLVQRRRDLADGLRRELAALDPVSTLLAPRREQLLDEILYLASTTPSIGRVIRVDPAETVRRQSEIGIASGLGLGLLAGLVLLRHRRPRPEHHSLLDPRRPRRNP